MKKFFDKFRKANKGFTLVELIIVIAVMAVLTVVVAPQYLKYVESSRVATDENAVGELKHICEISYVESSAAGKTDTNVNITIGTDGTITFVGESTDDLTGYVTEVYPSGSYKFKSNKYKGASIAFDVNATTGICTVTETFASPTPSASPNA